MSTSTPPLSTLPKALDSVSREGLWEITRKFGCSDRFILMVRQFLEDMQARVFDDGESSAPFPVTNGVKQGFVLAPTFFSTMFSAMLTDAFHDSDPGIDIRYLTNDKLFNLESETKIHVDRRRGFLFADDWVLNVRNEADMQSMDLLSTSCENVGLTISTKKTELMYQPMPGKPCQEPTVKVNNQKQTAVDKFTYFGSILSRSVHIDDKTSARIVKASVAFGRLRSSVWERRGVSLSTKLKVYRAVVLSTCLYAFEIWTVYQRHAKKRNSFHLCCLRKLMKVKWQDNVPDTEVLQQTGMSGAHTMLRVSQLRRAGHITRMSDERLPKHNYSLWGTAD